MDHFLCGFLLLATLLHLMAALAFYCYRALLINLWPSFDDFKCPSGITDDHAKIRFVKYGERPKLWPKKSCNFLNSAILWFFNRFVAITLKVVNIFLNGFLLYHQWCYGSSFDVNACKNLRILLFGPIYANSTHSP